MPVLFRFLPVRFRAYQVRLQGRPVRAASSRWRCGQKASMLGRSRDAMHRVSTRQLMTGTSPLHHRQPSQQQITGRATEDGGDENTHLGLEDELRLPLESQLGDE